MSVNSVVIGNLAEADAREFLEKHGLTFVEKNFTVFDQNGKKSGEIDLIMRDNYYLIFIEVKKRCNPHYGDVMEMISKQKVSRIIRTATRFLLKNDYFDNTPCRFDVVGISQSTITWIKDAFQVQY